MFLSVGHEKNVIYSKLVNNPFKDRCCLHQSASIFSNLFSALNYEIGTAQYLSLLLLSYFSNLHSLPNLYMKIDRAFSSTKLLVSLTTSILLLY